MTQSEAAAYDRFSKHYDLMVADRQPHIDFYTSLVQPGLRSLADVGCGTGTITAALAARMRALNGDNIRVAGIDGSAGMLKEAARLHAGIEWICRDLRSMDVDGEFGLVTSMYNTLQHVDLTGLGQAFSAMRRMTVSGGRLAFDIYKPNLDYIRIPQTGRLARTLWNGKGQRLEIREDTRFDESAMQLSLVWRLVDPEHPDDPPVTETSMNLWQHPPEDVEQLLEANGFLIAERYGDLDRSPYGETSRKQVIVCRKE
jgi:SAM-dependent methyltransferase